MQAFWFPKLQFATIVKLCVHRAFSSMNFFLKMQGIFCRLDGTLCGFDGSKKPWLIERFGFWKDGWMIICQFSNGEFDYTENQACKFFFLLLTDWYTYVQKEADILIILNRLIWNEKKTHYRVANVSYFQNLLHTYAWLTD